MTLKLWIHVIIHLSNPIECTTPRVSPKVNGGLRVVMMCPCRASLVNKCPALGRVLIMEEAVHEWGKEVNGNSLHFLLHCAVSLKLLLRSIKRKKKSIHC